MDREDLIKNEIESKFPVYVCDVSKNTKCKKTYCKYAGTGECEYTSNVDMAELDPNGKPIIGVSVEDIKREVDLLKKAR